MPGVELDLASPFRANRAFIKLLLPTLERPKNATSLIAKLGASAMLAAEVKNLAFIGTIIFADRRLER